MAVNSSLVRRNPSVAQHNYSQDARVSGRIQDEAHSDKWFQEEVQETCLVFEHIQIG